MVQTLGNTGAGYTYPEPHISLPTGDNQPLHPIHRPWCTSCKRKGRTLDTNQLCEQCARAAVTRAAQQERWAQAEKAEREAARQRPVQRQPKRRPTAAPRGYQPRIDLPVADLVAAYQAGATITALAAQYGSSHPTISRRLTDAGVQIRNGHQKHQLTTEQTDQIRTLYVDDRLPIADVAARVGVSAGIVARALRDEGITLRRAVPPPALPPEIHDQVVAAYQAGATGVALAEQHGVTSFTIYRILDQHGVPRRHAGGRQPVALINEDAVVVDYNLGCTAPELARQYGCTPKRIRDILDRRGVTRRDDRAGHSGGWQRKLVADPALVEDIKARYQQGATVADLARLTGHGRRQITKILREAGITIRPAVHSAGTRLTTDQIAQVVAQYDSGMSLREVAAKWTLRPSRVASYVTAAGHQLRSKGDVSGITRLIADNGLTSRQIKEWAVATGRLDRITQGLVSRALVEAYLEQHQGAAA